MTTIKENIRKIQNTISSFGHRPLFSKDLSIVAVCKNQPLSKIEEAIDCGIIHFAENYVQEAAEKWSDLKHKYPHIKLHLIGHLQRNKVKVALRLFDVIQTLNSDRLIKAIEKEIACMDSNLLVTREFFIQINLQSAHRESSKDSTQKNTNSREGFLPQNINNALQLCQDANLLTTGLMCILPNDNYKHPYFALLYYLKQLYSFKNLSMGMTNDYIPAVIFGSTLIRIGTGIFNSRNQNV